MFSLVQLSQKNNKKKFTRVAIVSIRVALPSFLSHSCRTCVTLVSLILHSCCISVTHATILQHLSVRHVVKQDRSFPNRYVSTLLISLFLFCLIKAKHFQMCREVTSKDIIIFSSIMGTYFLQSQHFRVSKTLTIN